MDQKKFYITTPIYYVNDRPHIGHAYTTIAADVMARYWRKKIGTENVFFLTGTDEHGDKIEASARELGIGVEEFVDQNAERFESAFKALNVAFDIFMRTTKSEHDQSVKVFMEKLQTAGALYQDEYEGLYCKGCEDFYTEKDLIDGNCPIHGTAVELLKEKNWFFKLDTYLPEVKKKIESGELRIEPETKKKEVLGLIKQGLNNFSVTRQRVKWGLDFHIDPSQKIYVWVEALQNYISAIGYGRDQKTFDHWWPADIHLMAKDIIKFHAIFWPAMLLAAGEKLPKKIFAHGFFSLNGKKMSKTLGNVIDPHALVALYGADATRYVLLNQFPFGEDGDIKEEKFGEQYNADLANGFGNLVARTTNMVEKYAGGVVEAVEPTNDVTKIHQHIEELEFDQALKEWNRIVAWANKQIDDAAPWKLAKSKEEKDQQQLAELLKQLVATIKSLAETIEPFMPGIAEKVLAQLNAEKITKGEPLFPRI